MVDAQATSQRLVASFHGAAPARTPAWTTVAGLLRTVTTEHAAREAVASPDDRLSYHELDERSARLARALLAAGIAKYSRVGFVMPNSPQWIVTWLAIARVGAVAVPFSAFATGAELRTMVAHADCAGLFLGGSKSADHLAALFPTGGAEAAEGTRRLTLSDLPHLQWVVTDRAAGATGGHGLDEFLRGAEQIDADVLRAAEDAVHGSDPATMIYTSGSTSAPKGVIHSHLSAMTRTAEFVHEFSMRPDDRLYGSLPFFWVGGLSMIVLPTLAVGACVVTLERPTPDAVVDIIEKERPTRVFLYPPRTMLSVVGHPRWATADLSSVERGLPPSTGAPAPAGHPSAWNMSFTTHGDGMGLGMSETFAAYWWGVTEGDELPTPPLHRVSDGWEVKAVDDDGQPVTAGGEGEVLVRGPSLCSGLQKVNRSEAFDADGFYRTGDLARFDGRVLRFTGRRGDMIKSAGANVSTAEVAAALRGLDGVVEAFVVGIPDPERGAVPAAAVVADPEAKLTEEGVVTALTAELASYKVPRRVLVVDSLEQIPMTPTGKLRQHELRQMLTGG